MTTREHYDNHLAHFYSWMIGDFSKKSNEFRDFLADNLIQPSSNNIAVDLGAGHGLQSIPLAEIGFNVIAVDFNRQLLDELKTNAGNLNIKTLNADIRKVNQFCNTPELIVCCGDTLSHLDNQSEVECFIADIAKSLDNNGKLILSFRDYSNKLKGTDRFIPVKSDENRILTCILDYEEAYVHVTDLLNEKTGDGWVQKISTYKKVRLLTDEIITYLEVNGMMLCFNETVHSMTTIIATKTEM